MDLPKLCRKVWATVHGGGGGGGGQIWFPDNEVDGVALVSSEGEGRSDSFGRADQDIQRMGAMASRNLVEPDFAAAANRDVCAGEPGDIGTGADLADSQIPYQRMD